MMEKFWNQQAHRYGKAQDLEAKVRSLMVESIAHKAPAEGRLLEIGCGNGAFLYPMAQKRRDMKLSGIDSNQAMLDEAHKLLIKNCELSNREILSFLEEKSSTRYSTLVACNTLHNLPSRAAIERTIFQISKNFLIPGGRLFFDVRNGLNPFVSRGYRKNRNQGLSFFTLTPWFISRALKNANLQLVRRTPIYYDSLGEAGKIDAHPIKKFFYFFYLKLTRIWLFAPYYVIEVRRRPENFVSIIWGYHKQFYGFSAAQNYQLAPLRLAKEAGYKTIAFMIDERADITKDPSFDPDTKVIRYKGVINFIKFLWNHRDDLVYANSVIWQNFFIVPFICKYAVFMAHDSIARRASIRQKIQNFALTHYWRVRVIAAGEKDFLIQQKISADKIFVAPMPLDSRLFKPASTAGKDIVFLGNVTPDNDIGTILKALKILSMRYPHIKLHIIGEVRVPEFYRYRDQLGITGNIVEHGYVTHQKLAELLPQFLIFVSSVISSGQHLSVFEAALSGLALCIPNTMQFSTVFKEAALFHPLYDDKALAENFMKYLSDPALIKRHNQRARDIIEESYSVERTNKQIKELFGL